MAAKQIRLGFMGMGVVGCGTVEALRGRAEEISRRLGAELVLSRLVVSDTEKRRGVSLEGVAVSSRPGDLLEDASLDVIVEVAGGLDAAGELVLGALRSGRAVVTANKALLAERGTEVFAAAGTPGAFLGLEGAVAGGVPVMRVLQDSLCADEPLRIFGILNGTANYILWRMSEGGVSFGEALKQAQELGYAEADPTFDVQGFDAAHKLTILASLAWGRQVSYASVYKEGISELTTLDLTYARELGYTIKLLGVARLAGQAVEARVHPVLIPRTHPLAAVNQAFNAIYLEGKRVGPLLLYGQGAGGAPTGISVAADIVEAARSRLGSPQSAPAAFALAGRAAVISIDELHCAYYLRFQVQDQPGVLAQLTRAMGRQGISIRSAIQPDQAAAPNQPVQVILTTHLAQEASLQKALQEIAPLPFVLKPTQLLRIEPLLL